MEEADLDTFIDQAAEDFDDGSGLLAGRCGNKHSLEVGRGDVQAGLGLEDAVKDYALEMALVDDQFDISLQGVGNRVSN